MYSAGGRDDLGWKFHPSTPREKFRPDTCPRCQAAVLLGIAGGFTTRLEPYGLDDQGEADALRAGLTTYDLHDDRTATSRWVWNITAPSRHPRLAPHQCGRRLGTLPLPDDATPRHAIPDEPEF